jgi:hypothetical protein
VAQRSCRQCGEVNEAGTSFCSSCGAYLGWETGPTAEPPTASSGPRGRDEPTIVDAPQTGWDQARLVKPPRTSAVDNDVIVDPTEGGGVELRVFNPSSIVEGYRVGAATPPPWLTISQPTIRLLPGEDTVAQVGLTAGPRTAAVARLPLRLRVHPLNDESKYAEIDLLLTVPPVGRPVTIRPEPAVVRLRDSTRGQFKLHLDNKDSNYPQHYQMSGSDDEGAVRFVVTPPMVEVAPWESALVDVRFESPAPNPGEQRNRQLNVRAAGDAGSVEATVELVQQSSAAPPDAPVRLRLEPAVLRTQDTSAVELDIIVDNHAGSQNRRITLRGRDAEARIQFSFYDREIWVRPGGEARTRARLEARVPSAGEERTQQFTIMANDGHHESEVSGSWVQSASLAPITTAAVRLEPEHLSVRDRTDGRSAVVVDNRRGVRPLRVRLFGSDPEGIVGFHFSPPVLEVGAGHWARAELTVSAPPPPSGQTASRTLRVRASDENGAVEAAGVFNQSTSPTPLSTARIWLEPGHVVTRNTRTGGLRVRLENTQGSGPLRVRLFGRDPEGAVRFQFTPDVLEVPPGQIGWSAVRISAPRPRRGKELIRQIKIMANDGNAAVEATGSFAQSSGDPRPYLRVLLTLLGTLLVAVGAFLPWLVSDEAREFLTVNAFNESLTYFSQYSLGDQPEYTELALASEPFIRVVFLAMSALMLFGLTGTSGKLTRVTALLVTATMTASIVACSMLVSDGIVAGSFVVVLGGIIGFVGGLFVKR